MDDSVRENWVVAFVLVAAIGAAIITIALAAAGYEYIRPWINKIEIPSYAAPYLIGGGLVIVGLAGALAPGKNRD
jgi:hypothetical protein